MSGLLILRSSTLEIDENTGRSLLHGQTHEKQMSMVTIATASPMASFSSGRIPKYECSASAASAAAHRRSATSCALRRSPACSRTTQAMVDKSAVIFTQQRCKKAAKGSNTDGALPRRAGPTLAQSLHPGSRAIRRSRISIGKLICCQRHNSHTSTMCFDACLCSGSPGKVTGSCGMRKILTYPVWSCCELH